MKTCIRGLHTVLVCVTISLLSGCFEDETLQPRPEVPTRQQPPLKPSPAKPTAATPSDPVSAHWAEKGEQTLNGKTCSTWWMASSVTPNAFFSALKTHVSEKWPKAGFQSDGLTTARYQITVGKNAFDEEKTAQTQVALANANDGGQRIDWAATVNADDQISATSLLKAEAAQVFALTPVAATVEPGPSQPPSGRFPTLLFPLGNAEKPGERYDPHTVTITSVFDHRMTARYRKGNVKGDADWGVTAFSGETGTERIEQDGLFEYYSTDKDGKRVEAYLSGFKYDGRALAYDGHPGYDFLAPSGSPVYAAAAGQVVWAGEDNTSVETKKSGIYVRILHDGGFITQYLHLSAVGKGISANVRVERGQPIGMSGNTGSSVGANGGYHLHFEVKKNCGTNGEGGISIDPYGWAGQLGGDPYKLNGTGDSVWMWETPR